MRGGSVGVLGVPVPFPIALGQVATRARILNKKFANPGTLKWMCRTTHFARDNISALQVGFANWYADNVSEHGTGGPTGVTASVEYPLGTITRLNFSGIVQGTIADFTTLFSDLTSVTIPNGAQFWVRFFITPSVATVFQSGTGQGVTPWFAGGDAFNSTGVDLTGGGAVVDGGTNSSQWPVSIIALTGKRNLCFTGDSRVIGVFDSTMQSPGDSGEFERPFGPQYAYVNLGVPGDEAHLFVASSTQRQILMGFCNTVLTNYGINDLRAGRSAALLEADLVTLRAFIAAKQFWGATIVTNTGGAWTLANGSDQVPLTFAAARVTVNTGYRAYPAGFAASFSGFLELADVQEMGFPPTENGGLWKADGTLNKYTPDGLHESTFANQQYVFTLP